GVAVLSAYKGSDHSYPLPVRARRKAKARLVGEARLAADTSCVISYKFVGVHKLCGSAAGVGKVFHPDTRVIVIFIVFHKCTRHYIDVARGGILFSAVGKSRRAGKTGVVHA